MWSTPWLAALLLSQTGVPQNGFPSWAERTILVLSNQARANPAGALASCAGGACPDSTCYSPAAPLVWDYDLNRSARFHVANLVASGATLQHPSPCLLVSNLAAIYPASCDGSPSCACQGGQSVCNCQGCSCDATSSSCVTQPFDRIDLFNMAACAENIAAGYSDPQATVVGWLTEACSGWNGSCNPPDQSTCSSTTENGHRFNILNPTNQIMGAGSVVSASDPCFPGEWDSQDFGCGTNPTVPKLVAGTHFPQSGTQLTFYANWYDTSIPSAAEVNLDGVCQTMAMDHLPGNNATYLWQGQLTSGCHAYVFTFTDSSGQSWLVPEVGAYLAGDSCQADYAPVAPPACGSSATTGSAAGTVTSSASSSGTGSSVGTGDGIGGSSGSTLGGASTASAVAAAGSGGTVSLSSGGGSGGVSSGGGLSGGASGAGANGSTFSAGTRSGGGCGCAAAGSPLEEASWLLVLLGGVGRRRRRSRRLLLRHAVQGP